MPVGSVPKEISVKEAMDVFKKEMGKDPGYAWAWHCNIAMAAIDEGMDRDAAQCAAAIFMERAFGVKNYEPEKREEELA